MPLNKPLNKKLSPQLNLKINQISCETLTEHIAFLAQEKERALLKFRQNMKPNDFFKPYRSAIIVVLNQMFSSLFDDSEAALLAIGGFGRGEVYPFSDIDLALVIRKKNDSINEKAARLLGLLWDLKLSPAIKVGTVNELCLAAANDITGDTAFLEVEFLSGNKTLSNQLLSALDLQRDPAEFCEAKILEQQQRHIKAKGAGSLLEANVKTATGALRDIHTLLWLAKAQGLQPTFSSLTRQNIIREKEALLLLHSYQKLAAIRIELHVAAKRAEDRLLFDLQDIIAEKMKFQDGAKHRRSEKLMRAFYRATKTIQQLNGILLPMLKSRVFSNIKRNEISINQDYYQVDELLAVRDKHLFDKNPRHLFIALELLQQTDGLLGMAPKTLRAWWHAALRHINDDFYADPENRQRYLHFFKRGKGLTHLLRFMNLYGALGLYLPNWGKIVGLLQHDLFHIYPVDDHILMVVRNMRRLAMDQHSHEMPLASSLMSTFKKPHILYLAALFHDIAKGRGGEHAEQGVSDAETFARDHGLSVDEGELLTWLVRQHLLMSSTAQKEDIEDVEVIKRFCVQVATPERLIALYLLTVCDIRGTNPKIWNSWKAQLLESLFRSALHFLEGGGDSEHISEGKKQANYALEQLGVSEAEQQKLWHKLGAAYFTQHHLDDILFHVPILAHNVNQAQSKSRLLHTTKTMQLMVYLPDKAHLFADLCTIIACHGFNILTARAYISAHGFVLDTFTLELPENTLPHDWSLMQEQLDEALKTYIATGAVSSLRHPFFANRRRSRHHAIRTRIEFDHEEAAGRYTLSIITRNRAGLLADISAVLSDFQTVVHYAKIMTLDERVEDSFLIENQSLENASYQIALKKALLDKISGGEV